MVEFSRVIKKDLWKINSKVSICLKGGGIRVDSLRGIWKPLCKNGVFDVIFLVYAYSIWIFNDAQVDIG